MRFPSSMNAFSSVVAVDFEYSQPDGELPLPICCVARNLRTGERWRLFGEELQYRHPPFLKGGPVVMISYYAPAEVNCLSVLGWPLPEGILDLCAEFKWMTSGRQLPIGRGLLGALTFFGLSAIESVEKESMRMLAMRGGPFTVEERHALLEYCESDVVALCNLYGKMVNIIDLPRALLRGRYTATVAAMEHRGIPVDRAMFDLLTRHWGQIELGLIDKLDPAGIWDGKSFRYANFEDFLDHLGLAWPRLESGKLRLDSKTFRTMARRDPGIQRIAELRSILSDLRLRDLAVGTDGRNRCMLSPFASKTGRNQPSNVRYVFGPAAWVRFLIKPPAGMSLAYIDWSQQELGIAAALSGDRRLQEAYANGDPYMDFAVRAGLAPVGATKASHSRVREICKTCCLGVLYGMGQEALALSAGLSQHKAASLLRLHREAYPTFWKWRNAAVDYAMLRGEIHATFGWRMGIGRNTNPRTLANFPMQANGAEMLRLAACLAEESGISLCGPVHDALIIEAPTPDISSAVLVCQDAMRKASELVLDSFALRTDAEIFNYPERFADGRGRNTWETIVGLLSALAPVETARAMGVTKPDTYLSLTVTPGQSTKGI